VTAHACAPRPTNAARGSALSGAYASSQHPGPRVDPPMTAGFPSSPDGRPSAASSSSATASCGRAAVTSGCATRLIPQESRRRSRTTARSSQLAATPDARRGGGPRGVLPTAESVDRYAMRSGQADFAMRETMPATISPWTPGRFASGRGWSGSSKCPLWPMTTAAPSRRRHRMARDSAVRDTNGVARAAVLPQGATALGNCRAARSGGGSD
jgi:hypothetical protein